MRWQPGESGNPKGAPIKLPDVHRFKSFNPQIVKHVISRVLAMDPADYKTWISKPMREGGPNNLELMVASVVNRAVRDGCYQRLDKLLERVIGKVREVEKDEMADVTYVVDMKPDGGLTQTVIAEQLGMEIPSNGESND